jgi:hypothetical protein
VLVEAMVKHRYADRPHWEGLEKLFGHNVKTLLRWAREYKIIDEKNHGPIVNGEHLPVVFGETRPVNPHLTSKEYLTKRLFNKREIEGDCWVWTGGWNGKGYGYLSLPRPFNDRHYLVHDVAVFIWLDMPLDSHKFVFHTCGNRACFNPAHFKIVKNRKALSKLSGRYKRQPRGENNGRAKITLETALDVRDALIYGGETQKEIAERLGINSSIVYQIAHKITWKHIWKLKHEYENEAPQCIKSSPSTAAECMAMQI